MPAPASASAEHIKDVNTRYHDAAASSYDSKWGIDFGEVGRRQVEAKLGKALGPLLRPSFGDALEIGAGTGYFSLNLLQLGTIGPARNPDHRKELPMSIVTILVIIVLILLAIYLFRRIA